MRTLREKVCAFAFVRGPPSKVLLLHRAPGHARGGWHPVTGHVERQDASLAAAAAREVEEETGLAGRLVALPVTTHFEQDLGGARVRFAEHGFAVELAEADLPTLSHEHAQAAWVTFDEARRRLTFRSQVDVLDALEAMLREGALAPAYDDA